MEKREVITPVDGSAYLAVDMMESAEIQAICAKARNAQKKWEKVPLAEKLQKIEKARDLFTVHLDEIAETICWSMGRPLHHAKLVINPMNDRLNFIADTAEEHLKAKKYEDQPNIERYIRRIPHGNVLVIGPWNYPFLTVINVVFPALVTGNAVILKHALQTHKTALVLEKIIKEADFPPDIFNVIAANHDTIAQMISNHWVDFVSFTGSVRGGREIERAAAGTFIGCNLELGGKDPAYILEDCNIEKTVQGIAEGSFYNTGQCCCGVERVYVRKEIEKKFTEALVAETNKLVLGNPTKASTTLGPMVSKKQADQVRQEIAIALQEHAIALIDEKNFPRSTGEDAYLAPQILNNVNHGMRYMKEETFGPCIGIMSVENDEEAISLMNDSHYGLTASIWSDDLDRSKKVADQVEVGTVFMNRCDYLDPYLPWSGVKDTGRGCSLSLYGYDILTKTKGYHLRRW